MTQNKAKTKKLQYFKNAIHQNDAKRPCLLQQTEKSFSLDKAKRRRWIEVGSIHNYPSQKDKPYCGLRVAGVKFSKVVRS